MLDTSRLQRWRSGIHESLSLRLKLGKDAFEGSCSLGQYTCDRILHLHGSSTGIIQCTQGFHFVNVHFQRVRQVLQQQLN